MNYWKRNTARAKAYRLSPLFYAPSNNEAWQPVTPETVFMLGHFRGQDTGFRHNRVSVGLKACYPDDFHKTEILPPLRSLHNSRSIAHHAAAVVQLQDLYDNRHNPDYNPKYRR